MHNKGVLIKALLNLNGIQSQCNLNVSIGNQSTVTLPIGMRTIDTKSLPNTSIDKFTSTLKMPIVLI